MPAHDWTRVFPGTFHAFHSSWIVRLQDALNAGLLPPEYYALAEQHAGAIVPDVLTLSSSREEPEWTPSSGVTALAKAAPQVSIHMTASEETFYRVARRTLAIRHRTRRRLVAMVEIVSPGNKDSAQHVEQFVEKSVSALRGGIHLLVIDLHPPGHWDVGGIHAVIWEIVGGGSYAPPNDRPLTLAAYQADRIPEAFVEPLAVGQPLCDMPIFLAVGWYVSARLEETYMSAYSALPAIVREAVEGRAPAETDQI